MIRAILMLGAEGIVRDGESNSISIFNMIEQINAPIFPQVLSKTMFLVLVEKDEQDAAAWDLTLQVKIGEETLFESPIHVDFQDKHRSRTIITIQGLLLPHVGRLEFILSCDDRELGRYPVAVVAVAHPKIIPTTVRVGGEPSKESRAEADSDSAE